MLLLPLLPSILSRTLLESLKLPASPSLRALVFLSQPVSPIFRIPFTGLYAKFVRLKLLPCPNVIFSFHYLQHSPEISYVIANTHYLLNLKPPISHFIALQSQEGFVKHSHTKVQAPAYTINSLRWKFQTYDRVGLRGIWVYRELPLVAHERFLLRTLSSLD